MADGFASQNSSIVDVSDSFRLPAQSLMSHVSDQQPKNRHRIQ